MEKIFLNIDDFKFFFLKATFFFQEWKGIKGKRNEDYKQFVENQLFLSRRAFTIFFKLEIFTMENIKKVLL